MTADEIAAMLQQDRVEWDALLALLDSRPAESLHDPENPEWTSRDVYNHFARWINHSTDHLEAQLAGRTPSRLEGSDDEINARWQRADSGLTLEEARSRAQEAFDRSAAAIEAVAAERWDHPLLAIARADGAEHFGAHRRYIEAAGA